MQVIIVGLGQAVKLPMQESISKILEQFHDEMRISTNR